MRAVQESNVPTSASNEAGGEQRRNWREPVVASGVLTSEGVSGAAGRRAVRVVNLSEGGAGLVVPAPLGVGMEYLLEISGRPERSGRVRVVFCRPTHGGFEVGAQFVTG